MKTSDWSRLSINCRTCDGLPSSPLPPPEKCENAEYKKICDLVADASAFGPPCVDALGDLTAVIAADCQLDACHSNGATLMLSLSAFHYQCVLEKHIPRCEDWIKKSGLGKS